MFCKTIVNMIFLWNIFYHFLYGKLLINIFKIIHLINIQIWMHASLEKLMNIFCGFLVFPLSNELGPLIVSSNIVSSTKHVLARTMQNFNDLAIRPEYFYTSRHILLYILCFSSILQLVWRRLEELLYILLFFLITSTQPLPHPK